MFQLKHGYLPYRQGNKYDLWITVNRESQVSYRPISFSPFLCGKSLVYHEWWHVGHDSTKTAYRLGY